METKCWTTVLTSTIGDADKLTEILVGILTTSVSGPCPIAALWLPGMVDDPDVVVSLRLDHCLYSVLLLVKNVPHILWNVLAYGQSFIFIEYLAHVPEALVLILTLNNLLHSQLARRILPVPIGRAPDSVLELLIILVDKREVCIVVLVPSFKVYVRVVP